MNSSLLLALRRRRVLLLVVPLLAGVIVALTTPADDGPSFTAKEAVALDPGAGTDATLLLQASFLVKQPVVAGPAAEIYGSTTTDPVEFASRIDTDIEEDSLTITFSAEGDERSEVERYVDSFAAAFVEVLNGRSQGGAESERQGIVEARDLAQAELEGFLQANAAGLAAEFPDPAVVAQQQSLSDTVSGYEQQLRELDSDQVNQPGTYEALGVVPATRTETSTLGLLSNPIVRGVLAAFVALVAIAAAVVALERLAPRVSDRDHLEALVGAPVLAMVPLVRGRQAPGRMTPEVFKGPLAESYRTLRVHLQFLDQSSNGVVANGQRSAASVAVVSPGPGDGKSTTVAALAASFAEAEADTLVLGCDFRRPTVHEMFEVPRSPGLSDRRRTDPAPALADLIRRDPVTGVRVLSSGQPTSHTVQIAHDVGIVIEAARTAGQQVVIDTAPLLVASETAEVAAMADRVVVVVRAGKTSVRALREAVAMLELNRTDITGIVMVGSLEAADYSYYYSQYEEPPAKRQPKRSTPKPAVEDHAAT